MIEVRKSAWGLVNVWDMSWELLPDLKFKVNGAIFLGVTSILLVER